MIYITVGVVDGEELYYAWHDMSEMTARLWLSMIGIVLVGIHKSDVHPTHRMTG